MPMPDRVLSKEERDNVSASNLVAADGKNINRENWTSADIAFIRNGGRAARRRAGSGQCRE
jgi:murein endopeptidase